MYHHDYNIDGSNHTPLKQADQVGAIPLVRITKLVSTFDDKIVAKWALQAEARALLPGERTALCLRQMTSGNVQVLYDEKHGSAHYSGLQVCGSIWNCPLCAAKISERRRVELVGALERCNEGGATVYMQTYTFSHKRYDSLSESLSAFLRARKKCKEGRAYVTLKKCYGLMGTINALEVTWSARNGWHVHSHELVIFGGDVDGQAYEKQARAIWEHVVKREGLTVNRHGYRLDRTRGGVADYVAKWGHEPTQSVWGPETELTKLHIKQARSAAGRTPFGLLADSRDGDQAAGRLFQEYAAAFKGRRQLSWSNGLRAMLMGDSIEKTDEELATELREDDLILLALLSKEHWSIVLANDARAELLIAARSGSRDQVEDFLQSLGIVPADLADLVA